MGDLVRLDTRGLVPATICERGRTAERRFVESSRPTFATITRGGPTSMRRRSCPTGSRRTG